MLHEVRYVSQNIFFLGVNNGLFLELSGSSNKIPPAEWFIKNRNLFLTVLEAWKSKTEVLADLRIGFLVHRYWSICCDHTWEKG